MRVSLAEVVLHVLEHFLPLSGPACRGTVLGCSAAGGVEAGSVICLHHMDFHILLWLSGGGEVLRISLGALCDCSGHSFSPSLSGEWLGLPPAFVLISESDLFIMNLLGELLTVSGVSPRAEGSVPFKRSECVLLP